MIRQSNQCVWRRFLQASCWALLSGIWWPLPATAEDANNPEKPGSYAIEGKCPADFQPKPGLNSKFPADGIPREFQLLLPGTAAEELDFASEARSGISSLTKDGWIVVVPYRRCTSEGRPCAGIGPQGSNDGRFWEPWYDGEFVQSNDEGPDVRFIESIVRCVASAYPVDRRRIYSGGISAGGTLTHRNLMFNSDFFAGGVSASGNYRYLGKLPVEPKDPRIMSDTIVVLLWGGPEDKHGSASFYDVETKLASEYYARQPGVVTVSCSGTHGHKWPPAFTRWAAKTVRSHPKGTPAADFKLTRPPDGFACVVGAYLDH